jgi:hypothetical protein
MGFSEDGLQARQHEVRRLFGDALLKLQSYELLMKAILAQHEISGPLYRLEEARAARAAEIDSKTLGTLVRQLLGSFLVVEGNEGQPEIPDDPPFAYRIQVALSAEDLVLTENDLRELVALRNDLVHHFLERHSLRNLAGCDAALGALTAASARIAVATDNLRIWAGGLMEASRTAAEVFSSPTGLDLITTGHLPWPMTGIVLALRDAEGSLAVDGWTPVVTAGQWISARYPTERPADYGCRSWRQVIHESGLFELRHRQISGPREAWYRSRDPNAGLP